jgi:plastocyanin
MTQPTSQNNKKVFNKLRAVKPLNFAVAAVILLAVVSAVAYRGYQSGSTPAVYSPEPTESNVAITDEGFVPSTIRVTPGTLVTWSNVTENPHGILVDPFRMTTNSQGFNSQRPLEPGETYSFLFEHPGTYEYRNHLDSDETITGIVIVGE